MFSFFKEQIAEHIPDLQEILVQPKETRNAQFQGGLETVGGFLQKYAPADINVIELIEEGLAGIDWGSIFTPDKIDDCDGYDPDYFGEEDLGEEEIEKPDEIFWEQDGDEEYDPECNFDDEFFRSNNETYDGRSIGWNAPENPIFIVDGTSMNDIKQNGIGDCWFLASLSSLATRPERVTFVIMQDRNSSADPECGYSFKFFKMGRWLTYQVDKFLPQKICAVAAENEHWVPYMEKAYAKKYGTYDAITGGWGCWGLTDLTGGIAIKTKLDWGESGIHELFAWLHDHQKDLLITSGINGGDGGAGGEVLQDNGLYGGHEYSLLQVALVENLEGKYVELINIRNPWGKGEFNGDWSDNSEMWDTIAPEKKEQLLQPREDGAFWMCYKDWVTLFSSFDLCLLPTSMSEAKDGPSFEHESAVAGIYSPDQPKVRVKMTVTHKQNIYIQTLMDCSILEAKTDQFIKVNFKDADGNIILPRLPNNYNPKSFSNYSQNGFLFNLEPGEYKIIMVSYLYSESAMTARDGMKWLIKAVGKGVLLEAM